MALWYMFANVIVWIWTNGANIGALTAAVLTAIYVWLTYQVFRNGQTPIVNVQNFTRAGVLEGDHQLQSLKNIGLGPALNVCVHQDKLSAAQSEIFEWLGSLGPGEERTLFRPVAMHYVEDRPHYVWYQDARGRWYATRLAAMGYGPSSVWEGRRWLGVPPTVRLNARAETVVQFYNRLSQRWLKKAWLWIQGHIS